MAFLRFMRDKRGYEHFSLVEATTNRRGKSRTRVLYWYRTPPNVRVGREPFDESVRRELEAQNPGVQFDWRKIVETPIPSAETERWRERRRAEKAEKAARRAATAPGESRPRDDDDAREADEIAEVEEIGEIGEIDEVEQIVEIEAGDEQAIAVVEVEVNAEEEPAARHEASDEESSDAIPDAIAEADRAAPAAARDPGSPARRRRRRRGRRGRPGSGSSTSPPSPESSTASGDDIEAPDSEAEGD